MKALLSSSLLLIASCGPKSSSSLALNEAAPQTRQADEEMLLIAAGSYVLGSSDEEREQAYDDYLQSYGKDGARQRKWFQFEELSGTGELPAFLFDRHPVTQSQFAEFIASTGRQAPSIDSKTWKDQRFIQDYESEVERFNWRNARPPEGRGTHPVVLVRWKEAQSYCRWRGALVGKSRRLPSAAEFEKAARGPGGAAYPWGDNYESDKLNSADAGARDTTAVSAFPQGKSALGAMDVAGNVFQWTRTPWQRGKGRMTVKGSAWDDHGGLGRAAAAHGRRAFVRHVIVGFRCAGTP